MGKFRFTEKMLFRLLFGVFGILLLAGDQARAGFLRISSDGGGTTDRTSTLSCVRCG